MLCLRKIHNMSFNQCTYKNQYSIENGINKIFECDKNALESGYCKFHDASYLTEDTKQEILSEFLDIIIKNQNPDDELTFIGYNLPEINFKTTTFSNMIFFNNATFHGTVTFESCKFENKVGFTKCKFKDNVSFFGSTFDKYVDFYDSKFYGNQVFFESARFDDVNFSNTNFQRSYFIRTHFKNANFVGTEFFDATDFSYSYFVGIANFKKSVFKIKSLFSHSHFKDEVDFEDVEFNEYVDFRQVFFEEGEKIKFNSNLSNVSFLETDITRIRFGNKVQWNNYPNVKTKRMQSKNYLYKIADERILENHADSELDLESVMDVYRNLRDNYEYQSRYDISGEFFVREMELKRNYKTQHTDGIFRTKKKGGIAPYLSILWVYNILAQYGQSYYRPIIFAVPILFISILFFWTGKFSHIELIVNNPKGFNEAVIRSISAFFPFYTFDKNQSLSDLLLRVILLPISGTFFLAVKRRLERQLRH